MRKAPDKLRLGDSLQDTWPVLLKTVKVMKNKESLRNCHRPQETYRDLWYPKTQKLQ